MRKLCEEFRQFRGQPIEIITDGIRFCGIDLDNDDEAVTILDDEGRVIHIEFRHIDAVIEPQMRLNRLCKDHDCDCRRECDDDDDCRHRRHEHHRDEHEDECEHRERGEFRELEEEMHGHHLEDY